MDSSWSISVKTVGGERNGDIQPGVFNIVVSPEDDLMSLHNQIEECTGLKASQQRLIYRGRIIRGGSCSDHSSSYESRKQNPRVKDVVGLGDGQTIHLVPRPETINEVNTSVTEEEQSDDNSQTEQRGTTDSVRNTSTDSESSSSGSALLAALLGLGAVVDDDNTNEENMSLGQQLQRFRSARMRNRNRRPTHRLTSSDLEIQDPGSMEPVRQGLMTLHTMLEGNSINKSSVTNQICNRRWYKGQWIDCRDTVNQWLEATIVDIANPDDILPGKLKKQGSEVEPNAVVMPTNDPAVNANDMDGRMRLLLEPAEGGKCSNDEWSGFKQRDNNHGVYLLLIHYNGWPHRWDEWIRSDSERIRPFRTRTRHPNTSTAACPTPQSHFDASPPTYIKSQEESEDRVALLPELNRMVSVVSGLMNNVVGNERGLPPVFLPSPDENKHIPWIKTVSDSSADDIILPDGKENHDLTLGKESCSSGNGISSRPDEKTDHEENIVNETNMPISSNTKHLNKMNFKQQLQTLAPLLDRLGRTLIDAAPHVASYAASLPNDDEFTGNNENSTIPRGIETESIGSHHDRPSLFSLFPIPARRQESTSQLVQPDDTQGNSSGEEEVLQPDYVDFVNGFVNTTRGEVRNRSNRSSQEEGTGLLSAYLAAASLSSLAGEEDSNENSDNGMQGLGRLLRQRDNNNGNGGIDIHIHAIVTGPGVGNGGMGLAVLGEPQVANARPTLLSANSRRASNTETRPLPSIVPVDEEELGIFSDLYSENPLPVDLQNGVVPVEENRSNLINQTQIDQNENVENNVVHLNRDVIPVVPAMRRQHSVSPPRRSTSSRRGGSFSRLLRRALSRRNRGTSRTNSSNSLRNG
mmetsp:Transcript_15339/g.17020  ORF Transcript_15339/g.17020 Transcript_15339/m.17020 type:complete len:863 (+) Transcript_15339:327-2915(+)|eukprot:CAMPEP_0194141684 /NCGR_PEP_ID=MMETSP0152-20130528/11075_1 /TAXON_ID=1049557 /ORGANISM="Thalassiothrix antarctica, Strain L6-D1" /LENGTH=862 /DNA_ID=CAMNT_0038840391 /DNA_START=315 /DNA_END=2903 /DNA_ORIENTATION=-